MHWVLGLTSLMSLAECSLSTITIFRNFTSISSINETSSALPFKTDFCQLPDRSSLWWFLVNGTCVWNISGPACNPGWPYDLKQPTKYSCRFGNLTKIPMVNIMNASSFWNLIQQNGSENIFDWCLIVNFYAPYCPFSARLAPHYNALPRAFPLLDAVAVDATEYSRLNNRYGVAGTPTLLLWHNGKAIARYEEGDYTLKLLTEFITHWTDLEPQRPLVEVSDADFLGPLPSRPIISTDWYLVISWVFIFVCAVYYGSRTSIAEKGKEIVRKAWREANENAEAVEEAVREENEETARLREPQQQQQQHQNNFPEAQQ